MKIFSSFRPEVVKKVKDGGVGIIPTDTLYGLVGSARRPEAVERIYNLKKRDKSKPLIILAANPMQIEEFGVQFKKYEKERLSEYWPGPFSIIFDVHAPDFLTRGLNNLAFRIPDDKELIRFIKKTGPLVAPSANPEGENPAQTAEEAVKYFKEEVDFYVNGGKIEREPSKIIKIKKEGVEEIRP